MIEKRGKIMDEIKELLEEGEEIIWKGYPVKAALKCGYFISVSEFLKRHLPSWIQFLFIFCILVIIPNFLFSYLITYFIITSIIMISVLILLITESIIYFFRNKLHDAIYVVTSKKLYWISRKMDRDTYKFSVKCREYGIWEKILTIGPTISHVTHKKVKEITIQKEKLGFDIYFKLSKHCSLIFVQVKDITELRDVVVNNLKLQLVEGEMEKYER